MRSALVVGSTSMLGKRLIEQLLVRGWQVRTAGRSPSCDFPLDLGNAPWSGRVDGVADALFHCAAAFGDDSREGAWLNERVNALGSLQVLELAQGFACKALVYAGTTFSCYRSTVTELGSYGASKARGENIMQWGAQSRGMTFCSLRFSQLYDELGDCIVHQPWFGRLVAYAAAGRNLRLPAGEAARNFIHVQDATRLMIEAAEHCGQGVRIACHPLSQSYAEIAAQAYACFGRGDEVEIAADKQPFREVFFPPADVTSGQPLLSLRQGLELIREGGFAGCFGPLDAH